MTQTAHAFLCQGSVAAIPLAIEALISCGIDCTDRFERAYDSFGIDEAREIRDKAVLSGIGSGRVFVIAANSMTSEAQNALLKTLEEPGAGAILCLVVPAPDTLLSTVRSRSETLHIADPAAVGLIDVRAFLSASPTDRMEMLKPLTAEEKDTGASLAFLAGLEREARAGRLDPTSIEALYSTRSFILDKGALRKPLLERLALSLSST